MAVLLDMQCLVTAGVSQSATICIVAYGRFLGGVTPDGMFIPGCI